MTSTRQFNVRVPDETRDILTRIATRLREDGQFASRLEAWLDTLDDPTADDSLAERVARIEARLDAMGNDSQPEDGPGFAGYLAYRDGDTEQGGPPLTTGEGRGRRLTTAGEIEVERRIEAGDDDPAISEALGVSVNTIRARRKKLGERLL